MPSRSTLRGQCDPELPAPATDKRIVMTGGIHPPVGRQAVGTRSWSARAPLAPRPRCCSPAPAAGARRRPRSPRLRHRVHPRAHARRRPAAAAVGAARPRGGDRRPAGAPSHFPLRRRIHARLAQAVCRRRRPVRAAPHRPRRNARRRRRRGRRPVPLRPRRDRPCSRRRRTCGRCGRSATTADATRTETDTARRRRRRPQLPRGRSGRRPDHRVRRPRRGVRLWVLARYRPRRLPLALR